MAEFKKYTLDIFNHLIADEDLLRLLHYKPAHRLDNPLDPSKSDILTKDEDEKWSIIDECIMTAPKTSDLESTPKCRLFIYPGLRKPQNDNFKVAHQQIVFDIFAHSDFQNIDMRNEWICEKVNELVCNKRITGIGKLLFKGGQPINSPKDYQAYRLIYEIGSDN